MLTLLLYLLIVTTGGLLCAWLNLFRKGSED